MIVAQKSFTRDWPAIDDLPVAAPLHIAPPSGSYAVIRPSLDAVSALVMLILASPVILAAWLAVKLTSPGPGFYSQTRVGRNGRLFQIYKLRTMHHNCEKQSGILWSVRGDRRVTPLGKFLRITHIDELPQLFNILKGEMSLIGPRPERPEVIEGFDLAGQVPGYDLRHQVRPGVTGLAQVQLPADADPSAVRYKVAYDLYAVSQASYWLDLRVLVATALKTVGVGAEWRRQICMLPGRQDVANVLLDSLKVAEKPVLADEPSGSFQPA